MTRYLVMVSFEFRGEIEVEVDANTKSDAYAVGETMVKSEMALVDVIEKAANNGADLRAVIAEQVEEIEIQEDET